MAKALDAKGGPKLIEERVRRYDWWTGDDVPGTPEFDWNTDFEIFVGTDDTIRNCVSAGHLVHKVAFTRYRPRYIFLNKERAKRRMASGSNIPTTWKQLIRLLPQIKGPSMIVTDARPSADDLRIRLVNALRRPANSEDFEIRRYTERDIADLYQPDHFKVYIFGGPRTALFIKRSEGAGATHVKIEIDDAVISPIPTYIAIRRNEDVSRKEIDHFGNALETYYATVYRGMTTRSGWWKNDIVDQYHRIAESARDVSPFDLQSPKRLQAYGEIIERHHDKRIRLRQTLSAFPQPPALDVFQILDDRLAQVTRYHNRAAQSVENITHFTKAKIVENAAKDINFALRMNDVATLNDPNEGRALKEFLIQPGRAAICGVPNGDVLTALEFFTEVDPGMFPRVFTTSFTTKGDQLDIWTSYGQHAEGAGLVLPVSELSAVDRKRLFQIFYSQKEKERFVYLIGDAIHAAKEALQPKGRPLNKALLGRKKSIIMSIKAKLLTLMHLYKHLDYTYEQEVRIIDIEDLVIDNKSVLEGDMERDGKELKRLYINGVKLSPLDNVRILIGPRYPNREQSETLLTHAFTKGWKGRHPTVVLSDIKYR